MKQIVWIVFALALASVTASAQNASLADAARRERDRRQDMEAARQQLVKEVLRYTNASSALGELSKSFSAGADKLFEQFQPEARDRLRKAAVDALSPSRLMPAFEQTFSTGMDVTSLTDVSDWYKSALGRKVFDAESRDNGTPDESFLKRPVSPVRSRLIDEMERETQETERIVTALNVLNRSLLGGMLKSSPLTQGTQDGFLSRYEQAFAAAIRPRMAASTRNGNLFVYRDLSDEELQEYIRFLASPAGRKFTSATFGAMEAAMRQGGSDAGTAFGKILTQMSSSTNP